MRDEFKITRQGKQYVLYAGLLDEAHSRGLKSIDTAIYVAPSEENGNVAICFATVEMEDGSRFQGIGDASPENVGRNIVPHILRMAETRAKARALRDAVNIGTTALEELGDGDEAPIPNSPHKARERQYQASESQPEKSSGGQATPAQIGWLEWAHGEGHIKLDKKAEEHTKREAWEIRDKYEKAHKGTG